MLRDRDRAMGTPLWYAHFLIITIRLSTWIKVTAMYERCLFHARMAPEVMMFKPFNEKVALLSCPSDPPFSNSKYWMIFSMGPSVL